MFRRFKLNIAMRLEHPLLRLLVLDWRFSFLLVLLAALVASAVILPLRIWRRTPPGFTPEITISTLDWLQARALVRSAKEADGRRKLEQAIPAWASALANDPGDAAIAAGYIAALLRSEKRVDLQRALPMAFWLQAIAPGPGTDLLLIAAADRNLEWDLVLSARSLSRSAEFPQDTQVSILKALYRTGRYREAKDFATSSQSKLPVSLREMYLEALNCILNPAESLVDCVSLSHQLRSGSRNIEAFETFLIVCAEKRDATEFQRTLDALRLLTDRTVQFEVLQVRMLLQLGRLSEARQVAARFRAPKSGREAFEIAEGLLAVGDREGAITLLRGYRSEFDGPGKHTALYARLLLQRAAGAELAAFAKELEQSPASAASEVLMSGIECFVADSPGARAALNSALNRLPADLSATDFWYFAAEVLLATGHPRVACQVLARIEPQHLGNSLYYSKLFMAAEASKDAALMRRVAQRSYQLAPSDPRAVANYAAMLVMCDEQAPQAIELSSFCLKADPSSLPAKVNYAAALINSDSFGAADLILREIDEAALSSAARNQLRFIKLKRAFKLRDQTEIIRLASLIDKSALYSIQLGWLSANSI